MAQPTAYSRLYNFVTYALAHTSQPYNAAQHDAELDAAETTLDGILANLLLIQRDDGLLKNASVHPDALSTATKALIGAGESGQLNWTPRGTWATSTAYIVGDVVQNSTTSYVCATAHTSGVFATDYSAGKWIILGETAGASASAISASAYGHIAATTVQTFLQELVDEKARLAGSTSQTFDVADATDDTHAVSMGQIQKNSVNHAIAGGSSDALTATLASGLTTLSDGMTAWVEAIAANTTTAPTFNLTLGSTATSAKTIKKGANGELLAGDIAGAGHKLILTYDITNDCWLLLNPAYAPGASTAGVEPDTVENVGIAFSVGSSALTATLKTSSGGTPTSSDSVKAALRSSSASTGTYNTRTVSSTLSLTISSGSTLGHSDATAANLHWYLIENGSGGLELAVSSKFFGYGGIVSTTAEGGSGGADSATTMYSTTARATTPFVWICRTRDTQTTAGTWAATPTTVDLVRFAHDVVGDLAVDLAPVRGSDSVASFDASDGAAKRVPMEQLPFPRGYLAGLGATNNAGDATNDIDFAVGEARDSTHAVNLVAATAMTKQLDATWAAGTNAGGKMSAAAIADTTYHLYVIRKDSDGTCDFGFDVSATAPTMPSGYTYFRRIGSIVRASGAIRAFRQDGDHFFWKTPVRDVDATAVAASTLTTFSVPLGIRVKPRIAVNIGMAGTNANSGFHIQLGNGDDSTSVVSVCAVNNGPNNSHAATLATDFLTDTSARLYYAAVTGGYDSGTAPSSGAATPTMKLHTIGWVDTRGRG